MAEILRVWSVFENLEEEDILQGGKEGRGYPYHLKCPSIYFISFYSAVIIVKNLFRGEPNASGYRDLKVIVAFEGFLCEIQVM